MKKLLALSLVAMAPALATAQYTAIPASDTFVNAGIATVSATTLGVTGDFRGIAVDSAGNVVVGVEDDNSVAILSPALALLATITNADAANGTVDPYQVEVSDDDQIYTIGFGGQIERVGPVITSGSAVSADAQVVNFAATSRGFALTGDYSAGTVTIVTGNNANGLVYNQDGPGADTFTLAQTLPAHGFTSEPESFWISPAKDVILVGNNGANIIKYTGTIGSMTADAGFVTGTLFRTGADASTGGGVYAATIDSASSNGHVVTLGDLATGAVIQTGIYTPQVGNNGSGQPAFDEVNNILYVAGGNQVSAIPLTGSASVETWDLY